MRINQYLARCGVCSRRAADELVLSGVVRVNGAVCTSPGSQVNTVEDHITVRGRVVEITEKHITILLNKPRGVVTTMQDTHGRKTVRDLVELPQRVFPIGRLDKESNGALLMTSDGELAQLLAHPSSHVEKTYLVLTDRELTEIELGRFQRGIKLDGSRTKPADIERVGRGRPRYIITLREGRNRQIRRMMGSLDVKVKRLTRRTIGGMGISDLEPGQWRILSGAEVLRLKREAQMTREENLSERARAQQEGATGLIKPARVEKQSTKKSAAYRAAKPKSARRFRDEAEIAIADAKRDAEHREARKRSTPAKEAAAPSSDRMKRGSRSSVSPNTRGGEVRNRDEETAESRTPGSGRSGRGSRPSDSRDTGRKTAKRGQRTPGEYSAKSDRPSRETRGKERDSGAKRGQRTPGEYSAKPDRPSRETRGKERDSGAKRGQRTPGEYSAKPDRPSRETRGKERDSGAKRGQRTPGEYSAKPDRPSRETRGKERDSGAKRGQRTPGEYSAKPDRPRQGTRGKERGTGRKKA